MKFSILFSLLPSAAASKGIHLRQTTLVEDAVSVEARNSSKAIDVRNVLDHCPEQTVALAECYGGVPTMLQCAECAWTQVLQQITSSCDGIDEVAYNDYVGCIDDPSSVCNSNCDTEADELWDCAKTLYCDSYNVSPFHSYNVSPFL